MIEDDYFHPFPSDKPEYYVLHHILLLRINKYKYMKKNIVTKNVKNETLKRFVRLTFTRRIIFSLSFYPP